MRAATAHRLREALQVSAPFVSAMTLSGCDRQVDWTTRSTMISSIIDSLHAGNFDWFGSLAVADQADVNVPIAFINFKMPTSSLNIFRDP